MLHRGDRNCRLLVVAQHAAPLLDRTQSTRVPAVFRPVLFSLFSAFSVLSVTSVLNSPFFFHRAPRLPCTPSQTSPTSPLPSAQSSGISPAPSPLPSAAPTQSVSTFPADPSPSTTLPPA